MSTRGSSLSRAIKFFKEGDLEEVEVAFELVTRHVKRRLAEREASIKSQNRAASTPRKQRRTRAQVAADKAAQGAATPPAGDEHRQESLSQA